MADDSSYPGHENSGLPSWRLLSACNDIQLVYSISLSTPNKQGPNFWMQNWGHPEVYIPDNQILGATVDPIGQCFISVSMCGYVHMSVVPMEAKDGVRCPELEQQVLVSH